MSQGNDTYFVDRSDFVIEEQPNGGTDTVIASVSYTLPANVEIIRLQGEGLTATGNAQNNRLYADPTHASTLIGGEGDDTYYLFNVGDRVIESALYGSDAIVSTVSVALGDMRIERLTLVGDADIDGSGRAVVDRITGNAGSNVLSGFGGNDTLDGGAGVDTLIGGVGDDIYYVDDSRDRVVEAQGAREGRDIVYADTDYSLALTFVEELVLRGGSRIGRGNSQDNVITSGYGNDILIGGGGDDVLTGGSGNDTYYVDSATDVIVEEETLRNGVDLAVATATYDIAGTYVENLTLADRPDGKFVYVVPNGYNFDGYGNSLNNIITGNHGDNVIDGRGGADQMIGGSGDDTYFVDDASDRVIENPRYDGQRLNYDTVYASVSFGAGSQDIERIVLTGAGNINATGGLRDDLIEGNSGNNVLDGGGGVDTLIGGRGDDTYYVQSHDTKVIEGQGADGGNDLVYAVSNFSLAGTFVESLALLGSGDFIAKGNAQNNTLVGNAGDNRLIGAGGADIFRFNKDFGDDTVSDFGADDHLWFGAGTFASSDDVLAHASQSGADTVITLDEGNSITLRNVVLGSLQADDFLFG
jgi:serralysin